MASAVTACSPVTATLGGGAVLGSAAAEERGMSGVFFDNKIHAKIHYCWLKSEPILLDRLKVSVQNAQVVLTGTVETLALKKSALELIKGVDELGSVVDEIQVGKPEGLGDYSHDAWITMKLWTTLKCDKDVKSLNYTVRTVGRIIYLMGTAQDLSEVRKVVAHASSIKGVKNVVNYTVLKSLGSSEV